MLKLTRDNLGVAPAEREQLRRVQTNVQLDTPWVEVQLDISLFTRNEVRLHLASGEKMLVRALQSHEKLSAAEPALAHRDYEIGREQYLQVFKPLRDQAVESRISVVRLIRLGLDLYETYMRHPAISKTNFAESGDLPHTKTDL